MQGQAEICRDWGRGVQLMSPPAPLTMQWGTRMGFFGGGLLLPVCSSKAQESGTEYTWLLLDIHLPKHIGFKDISRRSVWISGHSHHGPHGAGGNEGKLKTVQAECRKRQAVKRNTERYFPGGC